MEDDTAVVGVHRNQRTAFRFSTMSGAFMSTSIDLKEHIRWSFFYYECPDGNIEFEIEDFPGIVELTCNSPCGKIRDRVLRFQEISDYNHHTRNPRALADVTAYSVAIEALNLKLSETGSSRELVAACRVLADRLTNERQAIFQEGQQ